MMLYRYLITKQYAFSGKNIYQIIVLLPLFMASIRLIKKPNKNKHAFIAIAANTAFILSAFILSLTDPKVLIVYFPLCLCLYSAIITTYIIYFISNKI